MIEAICLDSSNRPEEIPLSKWINKDFKYHITHVFYHPMQGIQGCQLKEVKLGEESYPYVSYRLNRFGFTKENFEKLIQMMLDCSELNEFDVNKLLRQAEVEVF
jgi:hypothetical protein